MKTRVMIVDDEESIRKLLKQRLEREGFEVLTAQNAEEAERSYGGGNGVCAVVTDLKMPGKDGFELMKTLKEKGTLTKYIVITGHGEKEAAVQAVKNGATDYLEKPFDMDEFVRTVKRAQKEYQLQVENQDLVSRLEARVERAEGKSTTTTTGWYQSQSPSMSKVNEWISVLKRESVRTEAEEPTVLILGESGTGKEGIARQVHNISRRKQGPWVAVNCANFNEQLLESELFGHEKGSFTGAAAMKRGLFEIAKGGTLFLDEMGEMDVKLQAKLLRVLQEKTCRRVGGTVDIDTDVRVVAATNVNLREKVKSGQFREDLYHRLSRVVVEIPALCERRGDIIPMAKLFAEQAFKSRGKHFAGFTLDAETALESYRWPGNVRELLNIVERVALVYTGDGPVTASGLQIPTAGARVIGINKPSLSVIQGGGTGATSTGGSFQGEGVAFAELKKQWVDSFEKEFAQNLLSKHEGNVTSAAKEAQLDRSNFLRILRRHGIKAQDYRKVGVPAEAPSPYIKVA